MLYLFFAVIRIFVYPLIWVALLLVVSLFFLKKGQGHRAGCCVLSALILLYSLSISFVSERIAGSLESQYRVPQMSGDAPFDAIVALTGGVRRKGGLRPQDRLSPESLERLSCAREWMQRNLAPTLVLSGGSPGGGITPVAESQIMEDALKSLGGWESWEIKSDARSRNTYENAIETRKLLVGKRRILLVTSALHMPRAMAQFRRQGFEATAAPCGFTVGSLPEGLLRFIPEVGYLKQSSQAIHEWIGMVFYGLVERKQANHPASSMNHDVSPS